MHYTILIGGLRGVVQLTQLTQLNHRLKKERDWCSTLGKQCSINYDHYKIFRAPQNVVLMSLNRVSYRGGGPWDFLSPAKFPPPPRNLKINDVIIKMYDFSP